MENERGCDSAKRVILPIFCAKALLMDKVGSAEHLRGLKTKGD